MKVKSIIPPRADDFGPAARQWLESQGLVARMPTMHSSSFATINRCRFLYYLTHRLGLVSPFSLSKALSHGTWAHVCCERATAPDDQVRSYIESRLTARVREIHEVSSLLKLAPQTVADHVSETTHEARTATAWFLAARRHRVPSAPSLSDGFVGYMTSPQWKLLGTELRMRYVDPRFPQSPFVIVVDQLYFNAKTNLLWPLDLKTTSKSTLLRAATLRIEPQPIHYLHVLQALLSNGMLRKHFSLPSGTKLGGMIHLLIRVPNLRFGESDREYSLVSIGKRAGRHGYASFSERTNRWNCQVYDGVEHAPNSSPILSQFVPDEASAFALLSEQCGKQPDRQYRGEPSFERYLKRVTDWYTAGGAYDDADHRTDMIVDPPVNLSTSPASLIRSPRALARYNAQLKRLYDFATCPADPINFDETPEGMTDNYSRKPSVYTPFYVHPVSQWPAEIERARLIQEWRDEELDVTTGIDPHP